MTGVAAAPRLGARARPSPSRPVPAVVVRSLFLEPAAGVEDGLQNLDLLWPVDPPGLRIRGPLLATYTCDGSGHELAWILRLLWGARLTRDSDTQAVRQRAASPVRALRADPSAGEPAGPAVSSSRG